MGASSAVGPFLPVNVTGTRYMLTAAADAQMRRFIYLGAAMSLLGSPRPITGADESWPLQQPRCSGYAASKTRADQVVQAANGTQMATVVIRPGWVWGTADDPQAASFVQAVRAGQMRLIDGGRRRIVATHVDNLIYAVGLAIDHGSGGCGYYVFDDGTTTVRDFLPVPAPNSGTSPSSPRQLGLQRLRDAIRAPCSRLTPARNAGRLPDREGVVTEPSA
jgi:nucleoside-diphosphate-sugar epimerase